jgi:hypothetical protein
MAGDWIKLEHSTPDKPEVFRIAETLSITPEHALGCLVRVWMWADQQIANGNAANVTETTIDRIARVTGFGSAMVSAGWLCVTESDIAFPNFERHNGQTAKTRALTAKRVATCKAKKGNAVVTPDALPREEKRRVSDPPLPPKGKKRFDESRLSELRWPKSLDNEAGRAALTEWLRHKTDKGSPYKSTAGPQKILDHFGRWTPVEFQAAVDASIQNNYQGLFPAKENGKSRQREFPAAQSVPDMPDPAKGERYIP